MAYNMNKRVSEMYHSGIENGSFSIEQAEVIILNYFTHTLIDEATLEELLADIDKRREERTRLEEERKQAELEAEQEEEVVE